MAYTVKQLAKISGVTVRLLHFYDEIGLLQPAYYSESGYRFYEEPQLLMLQQILFFRELGFELKQIHEVIGKKDFDKVLALSSHKQMLQKNLRRTAELIKTIDRTIEHLKGIEKMEAKGLFDGFMTAEKQAEYEAYIKNRLGEDHPSLAECETYMKEMTKEDLEEYKQQLDLDMKELTRLFEKGSAVDSREVQAVVRSLYKEVKKFWTPNRESFIQLGQMYTEFEWKPFFSKYDPHHPRLAKFLAEGMNLFAENQLT